MIDKTQTSLDLGDQKINFTLLVEPESGLPSWVATRDEFWVRMVGSMIYDYCKNHPVSIINSDLSDKDNYAAEMGVEAFSSAILSGEALRFKDMVIALKDILKPANPSMVMPIYICFFSDTTEHYVSAMIENGVIKFAAQIGNEIVI